VKWTGEPPRKIPSKPQQRQRLSTETIDLRGKEHCGIEDRQSNMWFFVYSIEAVSAMLTIKMTWIDSNILQLTKIYPRWGRHKKAIP